VTKCSSMPISFVIPVSLSWLALSAHAPPESAPSKSHVSSAMECHVSCYRVGIRPHLARVPPEFRLRANYGPVEQPMPFRDVFRDKFANLAEARPARTP